MSHANITISNIYSKITCDTPNIFNTLWGAMRKRDMNYQHARAYKQRKWDGFIDFLSKKTGKFLTGLLPEVKAALKVLNCDTTINDTRKLLVWPHDTVDANFLQKLIENNEVSKELLDELKGQKVELRDFQIDFVNQAIKYNRGIVESPTSSGKTFVMISIIKSLPPNTPTLVLCNKKQLVDQNWNELIKWGFTNVGRVYDKINDPNIITCATWQSCHKIENLLPHFKALVVDEIHEMMSKGPRLIYSKLNSTVVRIAVSATPHKYGGKDECHKFYVKGHFGPVFKTNSSLAEDGKLKTNKLQEVGILSKSKCIFYPIDLPDDLKYAIYQDAVTRGIENNWELQDIVSRLTKTLKGRTLILVTRISQGDNLKKLLPNALWVQGKDDLETRKHVIKQLKIAKEDTIAIATEGIFNTGINVFVHNFINVAGGQAEHAIKQRIGRGLRTATDKDILSYYDFVFKIPGYRGYLEKHSNKRISILKKEGHEVIIKDSIDF